MRGSLATPRLLVRRFRPSDLDDFLSYQALSVVRRFMKGSPMSAEGAARYLEAQLLLPQGERGKWHGFAVERLADGRMIGDVGAFLQTEAVEGDVGFQFHPDGHGQGYASEAVGALVRDLFEGQGLTRVTAHCDVRNVASWRLMERLGLRRVSESEGEVGYAVARGEFVWRQGTIV